ncbi:MAG: hypothetical protein K8R90_02720 [Candidatus Cloacimonetes bacterium]|nr:hypothetical protein [Candidatus Cloacimonadota bacterium]
MKHWEGIFLIFCMICLQTPLSAGRLMKPDIELSNRYAHAFNEAIKDNNLSAAREAASNLSRALPPNERIDYMRDVGIRFIDYGEDEDRSISKRIEAFEGAVDVFMELQVREKNYALKFYETLSRLKVNELSDWPQSGKEQVNELWSLITGMEEDAAVVGATVNIRFYTDFFSATVAAALSEEEPGEATYYLNYLLSCCTRIIQLSQRESAMEWDQTRINLYFDDSNLYTSLRYHLGDDEARLALANQDYNRLEYTFRTFLRPAAEKAVLNEVRAEIHYRMFEYYYQPEIGDKAASLEQARKAWEANSTNYRYRDTYAKILYERFIHYWDAGKTNEAEREKLYDVALSYCEEYAAQPWTWSYKLPGLIDAAEFNFELHQTTLYTETTEGTSRYINNALTYILNALPLLTPDLNAETRNRFWELIVRIYNAAYYDSYSKLRDDLVTLHFSRSVLPEDVMKSIGLYFTDDETVADTHSDLVRPIGQGSTNTGQGGSRQPREFPTIFRDRLDDVLQALEHSPEDIATLDQLKETGEVLQADVQIFMDENPNNQEADRFMTKVQNVLKQIEQHLTKARIQEDEEKWAQTSEDEFRRIKSLVDREFTNLDTLAELKRDYKKLYEEVDDFFSGDPNSQNKQAWFARMVSLCDDIDLQVNKLFEEIYDPIRDWKIFKNEHDAENFAVVFTNSLKACESGLFDQMDIDSVYVAFARRFGRWIDNYVFRQPADGKGGDFYMKFLPFYDSLESNEQRELELLSKINEFCDKVERRRDALHTTVDPE